MNTNTKTQTLPKFAGGKNVAHRTRQILTTVRVLFWLTAIGLAVYFFTNAVARYFVFSAESYGSRGAYRVWLLWHIGGGTVALSLGFFQFSTALRERYPQFHRWTGRFYLLGVAIGAATAFYMSVHSVNGQTFGIALFTLASFWVVSAMLAVYAVLNGKYEAHRQWMTRNYVLTFAFVIFRLLAMTPLFTNLSQLERVTAIGWLCWTVPLFITEIWLQRKQIFAPAEELSLTQRKL